MGLTQQRRWVSQAEAVELFQALFDQTVCKECQEHWDKTECPKIRVRGVRVLGGEVDSQNFPILEENRTAEEEDDRSRFLATD